MLELSEPPLDRLRETTKDIAGILDPVIAHLEDNKGFATITLIIRRGELVEHSVTQTTKHNQ